VATPARGIPTAVWIAGLVIAALAVLFLVNR